MSETQPISKSKSFLSLDEQRMLDAVEAAHLKARIQELESELASCRECRAKVDCLSRGAVLVRDDGAERIRRMERALTWIVNSPSAHPANMVKVAEEALQPKDTAK